MRTRPRPWAPGLLAALLAAGGCGAPPQAAPAPPPPLVVLISLDTFRADLLDEVRTNGVPRTRHLLELARDAVRFDAAYAPIAFTLPSHLTMLTGLHPEIHGVGADGSSSEAEGKSLGAGIPTLAGLARDAGYRTEAIVNCNWMAAEFGFDRGFDSYERLPSLVESSRTLVDQAIDRLRVDPADPRPLFFFLHLYEAHSDFPSQGTKLSYYSPKWLRRDLGFTGDETCDTAGNCATEELGAADGEGRELSPEEIELHHELYRRGATFLDRELGRLFDALRADARWNDALIVVTSDHGEEFREHGRFLHRQAYRELLQVPLLIKFPGGRGAGTRDERLVELADLVPTLAVALGQPPPPGAEGIDLSAPGLPGHRMIVGRSREGESLFALRTRDRFLLHDPSTGESRLFETDRDPGETVDRAAELPEETRRLVAALEAELIRLRSLRRSLPGDEGARFDAEERARLRSLGYL